MVYKVSKGGVRSGNTLRGLKARRTQQYGRHACLIGFSNLGEQKLNCLLHQSSEENKLVGDTLKRTNVLLSLNKKQRWSVPAALNHMISSGFFDKHKLISMLERHKLKRRANCVKFASSGGKLQSIVPKQKKYFSFSLDTVHEEQSNREKRRLRAEVFKKQNKPEQKLMKFNQRMKTINTFTSEGKNVSLGIRDSSKDEYRVEVFYPCPQTCSLTFNPKYTDVNLEEGQNGDLEVKSNVRTSKKGKKHHRQRLNFKNRFHDFTCEEAIEEDVNEMWNAHDDSDIEEYHEDEYKNEIPQYSSYLEHIEILLNQAEKAKTVLGIGNGKIKCRRNRNSQKHIPRPVGGNNAKNPNIHYLDYDFDQESSQSSQAKILLPAGISPRDEKKEEIKPIDSFKVILKSNETSVEFLKENYEHLYSEGDSEPRRFMINVTDDLVNIFSSTNNSCKKMVFVSYIVFIHDGIYDDGLDAYRFIFNSNLHKSGQNLSEYFPCSVTSIDMIKNVIISFLLDSNVKQGIDSENFNFATNANGIYDILYNCMDVKVNTFNPSCALIEKSDPKNECEKEEEAVSLNNPFAFLSSDFDEERFCDICYNDINPTRIDALQGTKLSKCGHNCCDICWSLHFESRIRDSATKMTCPGYDCQNEIEFVTLLSILHVSRVALMFQRKSEESVEVSDNAKWCPNPTCGQVIRIDSRSNDLCQDVVCVCGVKICFSCFGPAHWPARCNQAKVYQDKLVTLKSPGETVEEEEVKLVSPEKSPKCVEIIGRICPRCSRFIDKNGGCPNVVCKCGFQFCWTCMCPSHFHTVCRVDDCFVLRHTRRIRIAHVNRQGDVRSHEQSPRKVISNKQKATLYQRAFQQRQEASETPKCNCSKALINRIVAAAHKDMEFKKEIIKAMQLHETSASRKGECIDPQCVDIQPSIISLIRSSQKIKTILHHVVEFSYVLLQDTPNSHAKQRMLKLANDLTGICSFFKSILDLGGNQNPQSAFQRLLSIQDWAKRALDALIVCARQFRHE